MERRENRGWALVQRSRIHRLILVAVSDHEVKRMGEAYKLWTEDMAASEKYKDVKPDWVWIDDAEEAEKVGLVMLPFPIPFPPIPQVSFDA